MSSAMINGIQIKEKQSNVVDELYEIFFDHTDLRQALEGGLRLILSTFGQPCGAIHLSEAYASAPVSWVCAGLTEPWLAQVNEPASRLHLLAHQALASGAFFAPADEPEIGGVFPLGYKGLKIGSLMIWGPKISPQDAQYIWEPALLAFARSFAFRVAARSNFDREKEIASLKVLTSAQEATGDAQKSQIQIIRGIQGIFKAEEALLIMLDEEDPELVIKKRVSADNGWAEFTSQRIEPGLVTLVLEQRECLALADVQSHPDFNPLFDSIPELETRSYICSPLISNGIIFGALALINPQVEMLTEDRNELFQILARALANAIYNTRLFMQLKVTNADLEANRWELINSRNTLRALFDNLPTSIYIVDNAYNVIAVNKSRIDRIGEQPNQVVGKKCYEKLQRRSSPCPGCQIMETMKHGQSTHRIGREWVDTDQYIEWEISTYPILNGVMKPVQTIVTEFDVTEKRILEADLVQSEKLAAVGQLAAGVAHEIYNPLTAIIANAQMMRRILPGVDEDLYESLDLVETAGVRASQAIRSLLDFSRKEESVYTSIKLNETIEKALSLVNHEIIKRPVVIEKDLQPDMPEIVASKDHLQGVWVNLIMNALDAINKKEGLITLTSRYSEGEFRVIITDNGKGIAKNKLNRIFEPYFTTKTPGHGTGLGLSVCFRVIKQHGGTIHVDSQADKGSKFTVILPQSSGLIQQDVE